MYHFEKYSRKHFLFISPVERWDLVHRRDEEEMFSEMFFKMTHNLVFAGQLLLYYHITLTWALGLAKSLSVLVHALSQCAMRLGTSNRNVARREERDMHSVGLSSPPIAMVESPAMAVCFQGKSDRYG